MSGTEIHARHSRIEFLWSGARKAVFFWVIVVWDKVCIEKWSSKNVNKFHLENWD